MFSFSFVVSNTSKNEMNNNTYIKTNKYTYIYILLPPHQGAPLDRTAGSEVGNDFERLCSLPGVRARPLCLHSSTYMASAREPLIPDTARPSAYTPSVNSEAARSFVPGGCKREDFDSDPGGCGGGFWSHNESVLRGVSRLSS